MSESVGTDSGSGLHMLKKRGEFDLTINAGQRQGIRAAVGMECPVGVIATSEHLDREAVGINQHIFPECVEQAANFRPRSKLAVESDSTSTTRRGYAL